MAATSHNVFGSCLTLIITISLMVGLLVVIGAVILLFTSVGAA